jgi:hypothetical protein
MRKVFDEQMYLILNDPCLMTIIIQISVQKNHQINNKFLDVKKAISKQDMDKRHDHGRMSNGYGGYGNGGGGYSK